MKRLTQGVATVIIVGMATKNTHEGNTMNTLPQCLPYGEHNYEVRESITDAGKWEVGVECSHCNHYVSQDHLAFRRTETHQFVYHNERCLVIKRAIS